MKPAAFHFHRPRRIIWQTDRTALVGIAWALLAFSLLVYWPSNSSYGVEPYVRPPFVHPGCVNLPEKEVIIISAGADGRLYFAHSNRAIQTEVIRRVAAQHGIQLTAGQLTELYKLPFLGLDVHYLPSYLALPPYQRRQIHLLGISNDSLASELAEYLTVGRAVNIEKANSMPYLALRADSALDAQTVKHIIRTFQRQGIHRFYLLNQTH